MGIDGGVRRFDDVSANLNSIGTTQIVSENTCHVLIPSYHELRAAIVVTHNLVRALRLRVPIDVCSGLKIQHV
jgi:hypothetical protein